MKISDVKPNSKVIDLVAKISQLDEVITLPSGVRVRDGTLEDETDQIKFSLWEAQCDLFAVGDTVIIGNGWAKIISASDHPLLGATQISTGKFGSIRKVPPEHPDD